MDETTTVFVYGTLKRGQQSTHLLAGQRFLGEAVTAPQYTLVELGWHPGMIRGGGLAVAGELWEVDATCLAVLDEYEGVPDLFTREPVEVDGHAGSVEAYFYARQVPAGARTGAAWPFPPG